MSDRFSTGDTITVDTGGILVEPTLPTGQAADIVYFLNAGPGLVSIHMDKTTGTGPLGADPGCVLSLDPVSLPVGNLKKFFAITSNGSISLTYWLVAQKYLRRGA